MCSETSFWFENLLGVCGFICEGSLMPTSVDCFVSSKKKFARLDDLTGHGYLKGVKGFRRHS